MTKTEKGAVMIWCDNGETWLQTERASGLVLSYVGELSLCSVELFCHENKLDLCIRRRACRSFIKAQPGRGQVALAEAS